MFPSAEQIYGHTHSYLQGEDENSKAWDPETMQEEIAILKWYSYPQYTLTLNDFEPIVILLCSLTDNS